MSRSVWTKDNIVNSPFSDIVIPNLTVPQYIWRNINKWADRTAVVCGITNRSFSYRQLHKYSYNFAATLRTRFQIKDGDIIGFMMPNILEYPIAVIGAMQAGAVVTTINPIHTAGEIHKQLLQGKPSIIVTTLENISACQEAICMTKTVIPVITVKTPDKDLPPETVSFDECIDDDKVDKNVLNDVMRTPNDVALLLHSSGTTGLPKGVELTNRNIIVNFIQREVNALKHCKETTNLHQDSVLAVLPFYHIYGMSVIMLHKLSIGTKIVILPKFQPTSFINTIKSYKINLLYAVPPILVFLGTHHEVQKEHLVSVDRLVCGGAPMIKSDLQKVLDKCQPNLKFVQVYGLTEISAVTSSTIPGTHDITTVGFAFPNSQLRVVDCNESNLGPDEVGELYIRGPHVMKGYKNNPEATKAVITDDGWLKTGDLASINNEGAVTILDRVKELIKVKGYQVSPTELEEILKEHPDILDVAVVGIPDDKKGEVPKAFVVLKEGHKTTATNIKEFVSKNVAEYKRISEVVFLDALPKNPSGKILRRVLKEYNC